MQEGRAGGGFSWRALHLRRAVRRGADAVVQVRGVPLRVKEKLGALARRHLQRRAPGGVVDLVEVGLHVRSVPRKAVGREAARGGAIRHNPAGMHHLNTGHTPRRLACAPI